MKEYDSRPLCIIYWKKSRILRLTESEQFEGVINEIIDFGF